MGAPQACWRAHVLWPTSIDGAPDMSYGPLNVFFGFTIMFHVLSVLAATTCFYTSVAAVAAGEGEAESPACIVILELSLIHI